MIRVRSILLPAVFSIALMGSALAQNPQSPMSSPMMSRPMGMSGGMPPATAQAPSAHIEGELAFLKAELKVTDAQSKHWDAFADSVRQSVKNMSEINMAPPASGATRNIVETMQMRDKYLKTRSEGLANILEKFKPLYESFTSDQKTSADQLVPMHLGTVL